MEGRSNKRVWFPDQNARDDTGVFEASTSHVSQTSLKALGLHAKVYHASAAKCKAYDASLSPENLHAIRDCVACQVGKFARRTFKTVMLAMRATSAGERLRLDTCSVKCTSLLGADQWLVVMDDKTKFLVCKPLRAKSDAFQQIVEFSAWTRTQGNVVKVLR